MDRMDRKSAVASVTRQGTMYHEAATEGAIDTVTRFLGLFD